MDLCNSRHINPVEANVPDIAKFLTFVRRDLGRPISCVLGYESALNEIFKYSGKDLYDCKILFGVIKDLKQKVEPAENRFPEWDLRVALDYLSGPPFRTRG